MNYDAEFCRQTRVSEDVKRQCLDRVAEILQLVSKAQNLNIGTTPDAHPA